MSDKSTMFDRLKKALEDSKFKIPKSGSWLVSPQDRHLFDTGELRKKWFGVDPGLGDDRTVFRTSNHVEPGHAYYIEHGFEPIKPPPFKFDRDIEREVVMRIARAFGVPSHYWPDKPVEYRWQRWQFESLKSWGQRLFERGLMDDPEIRWEYQKAIMGRPVEKLKRMLVTVRGIIYRVFVVDLKVIN